MYRRHLIVFCALISLYQALPRINNRVRRPYSAQATNAVEGSFMMIGEEGDWVTGGEAYHYDIAAGDKLRISGGASRRGVSLWIDGYNGDWFDMDLKAAEGKTLAPGEYWNATRAPFSGAGPGIDIGGNGRGCNEIKGSFIVIDSSFFADGSVERLDAAFAQHCEGHTPALRGRVRIVNSPPVNTTSTLL